MYQADQLLAVLHLADKYIYDKAREAELVYRTTDPAHPGVAAINRESTTLLGGPVTVLERNVLGDVFKPSALLEKTVAEGKKIAEIKA